MSSTSGARQIRQVETLEALLKSAKWLIQQKGFRSVGVRDLTKRVGVSVGTFYNYFSSKEDLVFALTDEIVKQLNSQRVEIQQAWRGLPLEAVFANLMNLHLQFYQGQETIVIEFINCISDPAFLQENESDSSKQTLQRMDVYKDGLWQALMHFAPTVEPSRTSEEVMILKDLLWNNYILLVAYWLKDETIDKSKTRGYLATLAKIFCDPLKTSM